MFVIPVDMLFVIPVHTLHIYSCYMFVIQVCMLHVIFAILVHILSVIIVHTVMPVHTPALVYLLHVMFAIPICMLSMIHVHMLYSCIPVTCYICDSYFPILTCDACSHAYLLHFTMLIGLYVMPVHMPIRDTYSNVHMLIYSHVYL